MRLDYEHKEILVSLHLNYKLISDQKYLTVVFLIFGSFPGFYHS